MSKKVPFTEEQLRVLEFESLYLFRKFRIALRLHFEFKKILC